ncbi:MAG: hypothetical protein WD295_02675 [Bacteroidota bacterium]
MKLQFTVLSVLALAVALLIGCKGPEGPAGPPGETVVVGLEGFAEGIKCGTCHDPDQDTTYYVLGRVYQWMLSKHAIGGDFERSSSACAECHTTEGYLQKLRGQTVTAHLHPSPPGCFSCHSPHARGDFSLRIEDPVSIRSVVVGVADATFNYGAGNLCASCHRTRDMNPKPDPTKTTVTDSIVITSSRWYPHYGVQGQMLMGTGGFQFVDYTFTGNSPHTTLNAITQEGCIACHMADPTAGSGIAGGHTMNLRYTFGGQPRSLLNGCNVSGCHSSITTLDYKGTQTALHAYVDTLRQMLEARNWLESNPSSPNYGLVKASTGSPLVIKPASRAGALFNFFFIEHDRSEGIHNTKYAIDLLKASIAELRKP